MQKLTPRQAQILAFIKTYHQETGYPPTRSEIATEMGFKSPNAAEEHLRALARKNAIEMIPGASRGIRLPVEANTGLAVVGRVAAGSPILASECIDEYLDIPPELFWPKADYLLTVTGLSMINAGIYEGDLLAVHKTGEAENGDIVVARIDEEVTVKRLRKSSNPYKLTLLPENDDFSPIEVDVRERDFALEGVSVGIIRRGL
ncbi:MAG: transcriptional repressor LexA [Pseudomonadales bacterium]|nr:transcriptional repressor LexA [Pseudomonadales bacterium]